MSGTDRIGSGRGKHTARRVFLVLALALGVLPLLPGVAFAHHAEISGTIDCNNVVSWTAVAWNGTTPESRTNPDVAVWYTVDGGAPQGETHGAFNPNNNFQFSGTFNVPASGAIRLFAQDLGAWGNGTPPSGNATQYGPLTRPGNCGTPDVEISKSGPATVAQGGTVSYAITVENTGTAPSEPVTVTDDLSNLYTNVQASSTQGTCAVNGTSVVCDVGVLAAGATATITITAKAPTTTCPTIQNVASVKQGTQPPTGSNTVTTQVTGCEAKVKIKKSGPATVVAGGTVTYTITVQNGGSGSSEPITVTDNLSNVYTNVQASSTQGTCAVNGTSVVCDVGVLAAGATATITITAKAPTTTCPTIQNVASVKQGGQASQNSNTVTTQVTGCTPSGLTITKSASAQSVPTGGSFTYTVQVSNTGNVLAEDVVVTDTIPSGLTITNVTGPGCSFTGQLVTCNVGTIAAGASATITITVTATAGACPSVVNTAHVVWMMEYLPGSADSNPVTVTVDCQPGGGPNVGVTKSASAQSVPAGGSFTYTVQVSNTGNASATNVVVTDTIPSGLTITSVTGPGCSFTGQLVTCNVGTLGAGASATITITVTAAAGACPSVVNTAHVTWQGGTTPGSADSNPVTVAVNCAPPPPGGGPNVGVTKSASAQSVPAGGSFTYTVQVSNTGNASATNVVVTDTIPSGLTITSVTGPGCSFTGQLVTCNVGTLGAGASATITITVTAAAGACPSVVNTAHVTWQGGTTPGSADSNPVTVAVVCQADLDIVKVDDAPQGGVDAGDPFAYTITVTNTGGATATGVVVTDTIPAGLEIDDVQGPNCSVNNRKVTCNVGDLAAGASVTIIIEVTAGEAACPAVENSAHVTWNQGGQTGSADSGTVETDVDCVGGETVTPTPTPTPSTVTPPGGTAFTGPNADAVRLGLFAMALLILGTGLMLAGYRRRPRSET